MNTAHTPGPWKINGYAYQRDGSAPTGRRLIRVNPESTAAEGMTVDSQNGQVCEIRRVRGLSDARLIASAPDLLAALQEIIAEWDERHACEDHRTGYTLDTGGIRMAREAIARAEARYMTHAEFLQLSKVPA